MPAGLIDGGTGPLPRLTGCPIDRFRQVAGTKSMGGELDRVQSRHPRAFLEGRVDRLRIERVP